MCADAGATHSTESRFNLELMVVLFGGNFADHPWCRELEFGKEKNVSTFYCGLNKRSTSNLWVVNIFKS